MCNVYMVLGRLLMVAPCVKKLCYYAICYYFIITYYYFI